MRSVGLGELGGLRAGAVPHPERFPFGQMYGHGGPDRAEAEEGDAHQPSPGGREDGDIERPRYEEYNSCGVELIVAISRE